MDRFYGRIIPGSGTAITGPPLRSSACSKSLKKKTFACLEGFPWSREPRARFQKQVGFAAPRRKAGFARRQKHQNNRAGGSAGRDWESSRTVFSASDQPRMTNHFRVGKRATLSGAAACFQKNVPPANPVRQRGWRARAAAVTRNRGQLSFVYCPNLPAFIGTAPPISFSRESFGASTETNPFSQDAKWGKHPFCHRPRAIQISPGH